MGGGLGRVTKHPEYYLSDGSVSFLTGNTLYRVHRSFFERESEVFRDLFASAAKEDVESGTDARPYTLDVKSHEFEQFLWVWYDRDYCYNEQPKQNWITILRLANRWQFHKIKELAIRELDALRLSPAERIAIYSEHGVDDDRLFDSYVELCKSPTVPTPEEARFMEMETLINILQAREDAQHKAYKLRHESPTSAGLEDEGLREIVSKFFKTGLDPRSNGTSMGSRVQASNLKLNGEHPRGIGPSTIILGDPQVPDRRTPLSEPSSHLDSSPATQIKEKESQEREAEAEKLQAGKGEEKKPTKAQRKAEKEKEREEKEKKEKEEKERKEREEKERLAKAGKAKQEVKEKAGEQKRQETPLR